jgi:hypothetical protein
MLSALGTLSLDLFIGSIFILCFAAGVDFLDAIRAPLKLSQRDPHQVPIGDVPEIPPLLHASPFARKDQRNHGR